MERNLSGTFNSESKICGGPELADGVNTLGTNFNILRNKKTKTSTVLNVRARPQGGGEGGVCSAYFKSRRCGACQSRGN